MPTTASHPRVRFHAAALLLIVGLAGCSDRKADPNYDELIAESCQSACPVTVGCDPDPFYETIEECIETCIASDAWTDLNQCDSRNVALSLCVGELTCEEYSIFLDRLNPDGTYKDGVPCVDKEIEFTSCDPDQPFEDPTNEKET